MVWSVLRYQGSGRGYLPECALSEEQSESQSERAMLEGHWAVWCLTDPSRRATLYRDQVLRSLVVEETGFLEPVSPRMHASPQTL